MQEIEWSNSSKKSGDGKKKEKPNIGPNTSSKESEKYERGKNCI